MYEISTPTNFHPELKRTVSRPMNCKDRTVRAHNLRAYGRVEFSYVNF